MSLCLHTKRSRVELNVAHAAQRFDAWRMTAEFDRLTCLELAALASGS